MNDDEVMLSMSIPLDSDGFSRWECPTCEREFKSRPTPDGEEPASVLDEGYFCPYCGVQAPPGAWLTKAQVELAHSIAMAQVVDPMMKKFAAEVGKIGRGSRGIVSARVDYKASEEPVRLTEVDDMTQVDFDCHPSEPVKVLDGWDQMVRCLICGASRRLPNP